MTGFYFSARATTKKMAQTFLAGWPGAAERELLRKPLTEPVTILAEEPVLVALPVYAGRIPNLCRQMLGCLTGQGGPAVAAVVYGNRDYDDALLELRDLLEERGFRVVAAAAFVGRHSIFTSAAAGRPDERDLAAVAAFSDRCREAVAAFTPETHRPLAVKGNPDYRDSPAPRIFRGVDGDKNCTKCRACVAVCPTGAISADAPRLTDGTRCISCGACIYFCPVEARGYHGEDFPKAEADFAAKWSARREPEVFF